MRLLVTPEASLLCAKRVPTDGDDRFQINVLSKTLYKTSTKAKNIIDRILKIR